MAYKEIGLISVADLENIMSVYEALLSAALKTNKCTGQRFSRAKQLYIYIYIYIICREFQSNNLAYIYLLLAAILLHTFFKTLNFIKMEFLLQKGENV